MKRIDCYTVLLVIALGIVARQTHAQEGLILPMPGQTINNQNNQPTNKTTQPTPNKNQPKPQINTPQTNDKSKTTPSGAILPMPSLGGKNNNTNIPPKQKKNEEDISSSLDIDNKPLLGMPSDSNNSQKTQPPVPPDEMAGKKDELKFLDNDEDFPDFPDEPPEESGNSDNLIIPPSNNETETAATQNGSDDKIKTKRT